MAEREQNIRGPFGGQMTECQVPDYLDGMSLSFFNRFHFEN